MTHDELENHLIIMRRIIGTELAMRRQVFAKDEKKLAAKVGEIAELNQSIKAIVDELKATMQPETEQAATDALAAENAIAALAESLPAQGVLIKSQGWSPYSRGY